MRPVRPSQLTWTVLVGSMLGIGCGIYRPPEVARAAPTVGGQTDVPSEPALDAEPGDGSRTPAEETLYVATYDGGTLIECADLRLRVIPPDPVPEGWEPTSLEDFYAGASVPNRWTRLERRCAAEILDPIPFGRCWLDIDRVRDDGTRFLMSSEVTYYGLGVVERDRRPRECEDSGGRWEWLE